MAILLSLGLCLPLLSSYPSPPFLQPICKAPSSMSWAGPKSGPATPCLCPPAPHSYHRAHQCLEQAGLGDGRALLLLALHLDSQLVRGRVWVGTGSCCPTLTLSPSQGHRVPVVAEWQTSGRIVGRGTAVWVPSPPGRILCLKSRGLYPALRLLRLPRTSRKAYHSQPENNNYLERPLPGALPVPGAALGPYKAPTSHPGLLVLPPTLGVFLAPRASPDFLATSCPCVCVPRHSFS